MNIPRSPLQQLPRFGDTGRWASIFTGGHTRQRHQLPPAERRPDCGEFLGGGAIKLFGVERAVFANGVAQHQIEDRTWVVAEFAITMNERGGVSLEILA